MEPMETEKDYLESHDVFGAIPTPYIAPAPEPTELEEDAAEEQTPDEEPVAEKEHKAFPDVRFLGVKQLDARGVSSGPHVETLRRSLGWSGDEFDAELAAEVKQVQEQHGWPQTGNVRQREWDAIVNS